MYFTVSEKVLCKIEKTSSYFFKRQVNTCKVNQAIDSDDCVIESPIGNSIEMFYATDNIQMKFLPRQIGEKLPKLKEFYAGNGALTVVRDFHFKNMQNLEYLFLHNNQITKIEATAFDSLVKVTYLRLTTNFIETLDEKLFIKMVNLLQLYLNDNKIKVLSPTTFRIPRNQKLRRVQLSGNVCIGADYGVKIKLNQLEPHIRAKCTR